MFRNISLIAFLLFPSLAMAQDHVVPITFTHTQPTMADVTSVTVLAANQYRKYLLIQNNVGGNIMCNLQGATLTGVAPTSSNLGIVLVNGAHYESPPNFIPTGAITCYQASGGSVNTVSVVEGK